MGIENYDEATLKKIKKGGSPMKDRAAINLLRRHGILSMATWVVGFEEERDRDYLRGLQQLLRYDPDQIQMLYATPHRWTPLFAAEKHRRVVQTDQSKWDYKHQVLATRHVPAWRVILWVKLIEVIMQMRRELGRVCCSIRIAPFAAPGAGITAWAAASGSTKSGNFSPPTISRKPAPHWPNSGTTKSTTQTPSSESPSTARIIHLARWVQTAVYLAGDSPFAFHTTTRSRHCRHNLTPCTGPSMNDLGCGHAADSAVR